MSAPRHLRGSTEHCPKCASSKVAYDPALRFKNYGPGIATCLNCKTIWEPFLPTSGKLIGETVASTKESCIIDLSEFESDASQRRFMLAFLVALYNSLNGDLLHLVLDEADMWAPQRILDKEGEATKLHHNVQKIVRRGRVKGFISWLITQRKFPSRSSA